jgi:LacI family transcriptional regulator
MAVTLKQIAHKCGVSAVTVSAIVRNLEDHRYPAKTKKRILAAARKMNYVPNLSARSLRGGKSMMLALVLPWNNTELMDEAQRAAKDAGYGLILEFTPEPHPETEVESLQVAPLRHVDGIVWMPANSVVSPRSIPPAIRSRLGSVMQVAFLGSILSNANHVYTDYRKDMRLAVEHLGGCEEIISMSSAIESQTAYLHQSIQAACEERRIRHTVIEERPERDLGGQIAAHLGGVRHRVGIFGSDFCCIEALAACERLGKRIPEEVEILAHGDLLFGGRYRIGELTSPTLSAIRIPFGELGRRSVEELVARLNAPDAKSASLCLPTQIVVRASTIPISRA